MERYLRKLIEKVFDPSELETAMEEKIGDYFDYEEIADELLLSHQDDIASIAAAVATDYL